MWLFSLAWKNLWRNKSRTLITMASIFFAVLLSTLMSSLKTGIFDNLVDNMVGYYSGYIQIHQKGYWDEQLLDNSLEQNPELERRLSSFKSVKGFTIRLESFALASSGNLTKGCLVQGIDPIRENGITNLKNKIVQGKYFSSDNEGVILTEGLLKRMKMKVGDTLMLFGQGYHGSTAAGKYPIIGVAHFGSPEINNSVLYLPLSSAQELFGAYGLVTSYILQLENRHDINEIKSEVLTATGRNLEVMTWEEMMPEIKKHIELDSANMMYVQVFLYILISFGIFGTLLIMMAERKYEFGMLLAIGMKKSKISILLLLESILNVIVACILGLIASIPVVYYFHIHPIRITGSTAKAYEQFGFEPIFPTSTDSSHFISQALIVLCIGLVLSLYPMYQISKTNPVDSMKR
jgi:ABC-type lipoprotein release transport system permease subunit